MLSFLSISSWYSNSLYCCCRYCCCFDKSRSRIAYYNIDVKKLWWISLREEYMNCHRIIYSLRLSNDSVAQVKANILGEFLMRFKWFILNEQYITYTGTLPLLFKYLNYMKVKSINALSVLQALIEYRNARLVHCQYHTSVKTHARIMHLVQTYTYIHASVAILG